MKGFNMAETNTKTRKTQSAKDSTEKATRKPRRTAQRRQQISIPLDTQICCVSGVVGKLIYESKLLQGRVYEWSGYGDEQYLDLAELQSMRNAYPAFFTQNWILIDDEEVLKFLRIASYYPHIRSIEDIEDVFDATPNVIRARVSPCGNTLKHTIASLARKKLASGELDSNAAITALEESTGVSIRNTALG